MIEVKPPQPAPESAAPKIFLAGSIEMGEAEHWQDKVVKKLKGEDVIIFNPRRENWDSSWKQSKDNPLFKQQVEWELNALEQSDYIVLYLDPHSKSPISLLEFGLFARSKKLAIVCPDGFWRKGNIDINAEHYGVPEFQNLDDLVAHLIEEIKVRMPKRDNVVLLKQDN